MRAVVACISLIFSMWGSMLIAGDNTHDLETSRWMPTVVASQGDVRIRRKSWGRWAPVRFGTSIYPNDLLKTAANSSVVVICPDLRREVVHADTMAGLRCTGSSELILSGDSVLTPVRNEDTDPDPDERLILLSPRWTGVLDARPTIRWSAPAGVKQFVVTVRTARGPLWTKYVDSALSLPYPESVPPLQPGTQYSVVITAGALSSTQAGEAWPMFVVVPSKQGAQATKGLKAIRSFELSPEKTRALEAKLLATLGLYAAAVDRLEKSPSSEEAATERILGSTYRNIGLNRLAIERYRRALARSVAHADSDGEALAASTLGELCQGFGLCAEGEARQYFKKALSLYQALGAEEDVKRLLDQLAAAD